MSAFTPQSLDGVLNAVTWTAIAPAANFDHVTISNLMGSATIRVRTVQGDASTEIVIQAGTERLLHQTPPRSNVQSSIYPITFRFPSGVTAFYLKADSGVGTGATLVWA